MALHDYLAGEVGEDWADGILSRREALRRLALLGLSAGASVALLEACAPAGGSASPGPKTAAPPALASAGDSPAATSDSGDSPALASAGDSPAGPTEGEAITFPGPNVELKGFYAAAAAPRGAMLVIHENRGLNAHIRSVASRLAGDGYSALAIDLLSEEGGSEALAQGDVQAALSQASTERLVGDMKAGLDQLERRAPGAKLGVIGFCFGGGMVWALLNAGDPRLAAAIPFYGPAPAAPDFSGNSAAVLGVYAELDDRVNASRATAEAALTAAGLEHEIRVYPGADHSFFNDTGPRYNAEQAAVAYADVLDWLARYLG
ncbi:MAG: dienelactone hydrolase family protein [Candidatus Limnocylindrales bacterium]|nr:dienelactone hydrolase family protein [Candidatus Limnocylindrales bacterium]